MFGLRFGIHYFVPFLVCNYLDGEETAGCFALIAFLVSCNCQCSVMEGYQAHNSNTHYALCLIPFTVYGCVLCFITKCLSVVCILRSTK